MGSFHSVCVLKVTTQHDYTSAQPHREDLLWTQLIHSFHPPVLCTGVWDPCSQTQTWDLMHVLFVMHITDGSQEIWKHVKHNPHVQTVIILMWYLSFNEICQLFLWSYDRVEVNLQPKEEVSGPEILVYFFEWNSF